MIRPAFPVAAVMVGGPQDGGYIHAIGGELPHVVHVGPNDIGDGYAAWSRERSQRFPAMYALANEKYHFSDTAEYWQREYDNAPEAPISKERIEEIANFVLKGK